MNNQNSKNIRANTKKSKWQNVLAGIVISATAIYLGACSSGSSGNSQNSGGGTGNTTTAPAGPISYKMIMDKTAYDRVNFNNLSKLQTSWSLNSSSSYNVPAGNVTFSDPFTNQNKCPASLSAVKVNGLGIASTTIGIVSGILNFIPILGKFLGFAGNTISKSLGIPGLASGNIALTNCMAYTDEQFTQDFNTVQSEINNIQNQLTAIDSDILILQGEIESVAMQSSGISNQTLQNAEQTVGGSPTIDGLLQIFLQDAGLINQSRESTGLSMLDATTGNYASLRSLVNGNITTFQLSVQNFSGAGVIESCTSDCYNQVQQIKNSALISAYANTYESYQTQITGALLENQNIVSLIKDYNNTIAYNYLQSVFTLQAAFSLEFMINQANYYASLRNLGSQYQISPLGNLAGTYYGYATIESTNFVAQTNAYNQAQQQLTMVYAARFNQLYINTIQYLMSDLPAPFQIESNTLTYVDNDSNTLITALESNAYMVNAGVNVTRPLSYTPGNSWKNGYNGSEPQTGILYQASGLKNPALCTSAIESYILNSADMNIAESLSEVNCPSLYAGNTGVVTESGYYDVLTIAPYMANSNNNSIVLTQPVYNMLPSCSFGNTIGKISGDMSFWTPSATNSPTGESATYLLCNIWNPDAQSSIVTNYYESYAVITKPYPYDSGDWQTFSPSNWIGYTGYSTSDQLYYTRTNQSYQAYSNIPFAITNGVNTELTMIPISSNYAGVFYPNNSSATESQFYGYLFSLESGTENGTIWASSPTGTTSATPSILLANLNVGNLDGFNAPFGVGYILYSAAMTYYQDQIVGTYYFPMEEIALSCGNIESNITVTNNSGTKVPLCLASTDGSISYYGKYKITPTLPSPYFIPVNITSFALKLDSDLYLYSANFSGINMYSNNPNSGNGLPSVPLILNFRSQ